MPNDHRMLGNLVALVVNHLMYRLATLNSYQSQYGIRNGNGITRNLKYKILNAKYKNISLKKQKSLKWNLTSKLESRVFDYSHWFQAKMENRLKITKIISF